MTRKMFPHESETIEFCSQKPRSCASLWHILSRAGLIWGEDIWSMPRQDIVPNAQSENYVSVSIFLDDEELYLDEEEVFDAREDPQWNKIELKYLLATLPEAGIEFFIACSETISLSLQLPILYDGQTIEATELQKRFHQFCDYLEVEYGGVGSQTINHFIDIHYS